MEINKTYTFEEIEKLSLNGDFELEEFGKFLIGKSFIALTNNDEIISFVLIGIQRKNAIFKCIYLDS